MHSDEIDRFDEHEIGSLLQLADDLAHGAHSLRQRVAHAEADEALQRSEATLKAVNDAIPDLVRVLGRASPA